MKKVAPVFIMTPNKKPEAAINCSFVKKAPNEFRQPEEKYL